MLVQVNHIPETMQDTPQTKKITVGIDMGGKSWVANLLFHDSGKQRTLTFKGTGKELECLNELHRWQKGANDVHAIYEAGRYGFTPARVFNHFGIGLYRRTDQ